MTSSFVTVTLNPAIDQTVYLDRLRHGKVNIAQRATQHAAGKGVNVAVCLADWGAKPCALGLLGEANSGMFEALFQQRGIRDAFTRVAGQTRTNLKLVEPDGMTTDINLAGLTADAAQLDAVSDRLTAQISQNTVVVLSGSVPPGLDPDAWARLLHQANRRGARTLLDTSGPALHAALASHTSALPFAIKPNRHELEALLGHPLSDHTAVYKAALRLVAKGIHLIVVSMGRDGALFVTQQQALIARPTRFANGSSVGAGDAMVAGLASALQHTPFDLDLCARQATAFSLGFLESGDQRRITHAAIRSLASDAVTLEHLAAPTHISLE